MNIYLLERTDIVKYDKCKSFVCIARTRKEALYTLPMNALTWQRIDEKDWVKRQDVEDLITITRIGKASKKYDNLKEPLVIHSAWNWA